MCEGAELAGAEEDESKISALPEFTEFMSLDRSYPLSPLPGTSESW